MPFFTCCETKVVPYKESPESSKVNSVIAEPLSPTSKKELMFSNRVELDRVKKKEKDAPEDKLKPKKVGFEGYKKSSRASQ